MIDLKNHEPANPEFKLPKNVSFPRVIFEGAKNMDDIRKHLSGAFIAESMTSATAVRYLDDFERCAIRANYGELLEDEQPKLEAQLDEIKAKAKAQVKDAEDKLQACNTQIRDLVYQVKKGDKEVDLPADSTVRIPIDGYYLFYAWVNEEFRLVRADKIPSWEEQTLFANQETNKKAFKEVLGIDIDEAHNGEASAQERAEE